MALIIFPLHFCLQLLTVVFFGSSIILLAIPKFLLPLSAFRRAVNNLSCWLLGNYGVVSIALLNLFNRTEWDCVCNGEINKNSWYLLTSNHISYLDIILLLKWAQGRIPSPKFFIKQELIWMPLVGQAAWALDMPFMKRYSREQIRKNPALRNKDIETTRQHCNKYKLRPTTVINFVEGTRFTSERHKKACNKGSALNHLLPPKAGGIAFTLASMGELFEEVIDVTLLYPHNTGNVMFAMLCGNLKKVVMHVNVIKLEGATKAAMIGDYYNDNQFKQQFQANLNTHWATKDKTIAQYLESANNPLLSSDRAQSVTASQK